MASDIIRIGLIGYGSWARSAYVPSFRLDGRTNIFAVAAPSEVTRALATTELGPNVRTFGSASELLAAGSIDAVTIAVPDPAHEETMAAVMEAGLPLLFEPPVAADRDGVERMLTTVRAYQLPIHPNLELSYLPVIARVHDHVSAGAIGQPQHAHIRLQAGWRHPPGLALSVIHMLACWYLDVLDLVACGQVQRVLVPHVGRSTDLLRPRAIAHLDYGNLLGTFDVNIAAVGSLSIDIEVNGSDGDIACDPLAGTWRLRTRDYPHWRMARDAPLEPVAGWPGVHESIRAFLDSVEQGLPATDARDAILRHHEVGLAVDRSYRTGAWETVGHTPPVRSNCQGSSPHVK